MEEPNEENHELSKLTESEILMLEQELLTIAYQNSYLLITNKTTFEDLLVQKHKSGNSAILAHDPHADLELTEVENIIDHFIQLEEYEKCQELKLVMDDQCK
jgi:hypothetical protein|tara:strand:+ start:13144 stop:13449 length:306 start_codon:yes stop_codon:yes gene_type:complete